MPIPRAASTTPGLISVTPTYVFVMIGGIASATSAMNAGKETMPIVVR